MSFKLDSFHHVPSMRDISEEEPIMINPYEEQPPEQRQRFDGTSIRALTEKGDVSYGLDWKELNEERMGV